MASGSADAWPTPGDGLYGYAKAMRCGNLDSSIGGGGSEYGSCHGSVYENWDAPDVADATDAAHEAKPSTSARDAAPILLEEHAEPDLQVASPSDDEEMDCVDTSVVDGAAPVVGTPQVTLVNKRDFLPVMMLPVSPQGTLMQPVPSVRFVNLIDDMLYYVWVCFVREGGHVEGDYMHPDSPLLGFYWNDTIVSFSRLKVYAANGFERRPISLICNTKYFLQINYCIVNDAGHTLANTVISKRLVGTCFVPVNWDISSTPAKKSNTGSEPPYKRAKH